MPDWLYITKARAIESGMTHEGSLFGVPAWFEGDDNECVMATPKVPMLNAWCWFADKCFELASLFILSDAVLVSPIAVKNKIGA
jgi:hypothetical protein